jgi:nitrogen fixation/metabolism regulation signal transduction histidine kinase
VPFILRIARIGVVAAMVVAVVGWGVEYVRFGPSDATALARLERDLRRRFDASAGTLAALAARVASARAIIVAASRNPEEATRLFDLVAAATADDETGRTGITVYDAGAVPIAWAGRVSDLPKARIQGARSVFVAPGALGPRLIHIEPLVDAASGPGGRTTIVVEQSLGDTQGTPGRGDTFILSSALAPVTVHASVPSAPAPARPFSFTINAPDGAALVDAEVTPSDLANARARWRQLVKTAVLLLVALTLLLCTAPFIDRRRGTRRIAAFVIATAAVVGLLVAARFVMYFALRPFAPPGEPTPFDLLCTTLSMTALVWLGVDLIERRRVARPRVPVVGGSARSAPIAAAAYLATGAATVWLLSSYEQVLRTIVADSSFDLLHFSLHPLNYSRLALSFSVVLLHAAAIWTAAGIIRLPSVFLRVPRPLARRLAIGPWLAGVVAALVALRADATVPVLPLLLAVAAAGISAAALVLLRSRGRRASQAARMFALLLGLVMPALAMYPSLFAFGAEAKENLVANTYGPQALRQREDLKEQLQQSVDEIDALPSLADFVVGTNADTPTTDRAFLVWSRTELAVHRLTSAVELYGADGRLVSRFALNLPEYTTPPYIATGCNWDSLEEVSPFGSSERHVLRAGRGICDGRRRPIGAIVVRAMLDPRTLPFISSQNPYLESLRETRRVREQEAVSGRDVEFAVYGWSRSPLYASGTSVWTLPDSVFQRTVESREPFWTTIDRDDDTFRVYVLNDRGGIYALGYPQPTWQGQLITIAELVMLAFVLYVALLVGATLFSALMLRTPQSGRALFGEIRRSFYHKLFLFFVAGAVVPVVILAVVTRNYFAAQLDASATENAARTVTTAQRLVEDYAALQARGTTALGAIDDQIMVLVRRAVDEDVNLFDRSRLQATSARDLFASQLLPMRTPAAVYKHILLDRLPTFVGEEEVAGSRYRLAAAPVRTGGRDGIVSVPLTNRQQQFEQQIDELDRRVISAAVLFSLLGAALGYWMAERIADPVNRLTRATRRIARGDLDARIAATSSDELRRLVEDFNQMAADLKRQRSELERTQRLEAWADMARQVAHDIKNPLTPIQLSAEHAQRVNMDRGRPLSPVLDDCVKVILGQVALLRQISAEFSSFASSPTPRPEPTSLGALIHEVVEPYRVALAGRIGVDVHAAPDLPELSIDRTLFARALTNVIENALHAMPGGGRLTVTAARATTGRAAIIEIGDTGVGMDQSALDKIFEPYFSTKATGTGLGLTIAKRNVALNGGTIDVRSERGVGTTVTMTLPISAAL